MGRYIPAHPSPSTAVPFPCEIRITECVFGKLRWSVGPSAMPPRKLSRRLLLSAPALSVASSQSPNSAHTTLTAAQVIDRIKANVGVPWRQQTVDNIIAGSPDTTVDGIATTMIATLDVLKRATAARKNLVITHESTFFS